jgi:DNA repair protein SbcC/Rad50
MIPQKLELTNFLSYRDTVDLDFEGIHLACISGANGAGKSTILDAITWSLFGRSRSRSDDDVVNRLAAIQDEPAEVRFTFSLENNSYRVQRSKRSRKSGALELQIASGDNSWKTLSENKLRETQAAIEKLLKMNYETFTNSSLLLQGKADEFTTRTPNQRKEILANLLGVTEWEHYREIVTEARKIEQGKFAFLDSRLEEIKRELDEEADRRAQLKEAQNNRDIITDKLRLQEQLLNQMRQTSAAADQQETLVANLRKSVERILRNLENSKQTHEKRQEERNSYQAIIAGAAIIEAEFAAWQIAEAEARNWQEKANSYNHLLQEKQPFDLQVAQSRSRLEQNQIQLEEQERQVSNAVENHPKLEKGTHANEKRLAEINILLEKLTGVQEELYQAREKLQQITGERRLLQKELGQIREKERQVQQLEVHKNAISKNKSEAEKRLNALENELGTIAAYNDAYFQSLADLDSLKNQQPLLRKEMDKLKERIDQLQSSDDESECPLCGQPLSESHRHQVVEELTQDGKERANLFRANSTRLQDLEIEVPNLQQKIKQKPQFERDQKAQQQRLAQAEAQLAEIDQQIREWHQSGNQRLSEIEALLADTTTLNEQEKQVGELEIQLGPRDDLHKEQQALQQEISNGHAQLNTLDNLIRDWESIGKAKLKTVRRQLAEEAFEPEARAAIAALQVKISDLGYDLAADLAARDKRDGLAGAEVRFQELKQAAAAVKPLENTLIDLEQSIQEQEDNLEEQQKQLQTAGSQLATLREGIVDINKTEDQVNKLREEEIVANRLVGRAEQRLAVLDDLRELREQIEQDKTAYSLRIQRLKLLEKSCGRSGVQALLIEHALPEIEERANQLLDRLSGGDMSITFETQRKLKTRDDLSETLDIRIADKDGERPYENYSGGEQFRVNFAIRLALSQLLAKRSGARLQTLIVDEGFGSQDPQGRQRLVEAINIVRDEFACILVITHIDELRDAFPTRIEVTKGLGGSNINVI